MNADVLVINWELQVITSGEVLIIINLGESGLVGRNRSRQREGMVFCNWN